MNNPSDKKQGVQTTGHVWDDDLCEYNNPLPRWWLWTFYGTVFFAILYWLLYPAWPVGSSYTKGLFNDITYTVNGEEVTTHWNTRALFMRDMQSSPAAVRQREFLDVIAATDYEDLLADADKLAFVRSYGRGIFGDYCAACHQTGGTGIVGRYPNLSDDDWLWGGSVADIERTIMHGRLGYMPPFRETFDAEQLDVVAEYVLSLSGIDGGDAAKAQRGEVIFKGMAGGCFHCHGADGKGLPSQGAPNLTDSVWTIANVPAAETFDAKKEAVKGVIHNGVQRQMPAFGERLSPVEVKVLTAYVHQLGGGQ
ncbi:MAG: cytochrome-c oxidase, cbb3-type subunit III [Chromatiales bacterium]|jgi:cytochrome c oxidase cbb3-type subunit 3|nr:cytochrome-c oxidase, cbb3-type subunit III [Chromatiales bacterium]MDX9767372.1 cytochrome-c oxidase, cbb3-type subunit III [Ectothiorhodospiraceae bacterium]